MKWADLHSWNLSVEAARQLQDELRRRVSLEDDPRLSNLWYVAGCDVAYSQDEDLTTAYAAVVVLSFPGLEVVERQTAALPVAFPYIPGLLAFREMPALLEAFARVEKEPDVVLMDAHGIAHPRGIGEASHLGLWLEVPTIGCAKRRLMGEFAQPGPGFGEWSPLAEEGERVGAALRTLPGGAPVFVSPGHRVNLETALRVVMGCCRGGHRLPEPLRLAHELAGEVRRG